MYSSTIFAFTQMLAEMRESCLALFRCSPLLTAAYSLMCAVAFFLLLYYGVGFDKASSRAGYFFVMCLLTEIYAVTLGQAVAALSPSITVAALFNPFLLVMFSVFCGVVAPKQTLPYFWRSWMYQLDPFTRLISGVVSTALWNQPVVCRDDEYSVFPAPSGQTCREYAGAFADAVGGYLGNPDATGDCNFCQYSNGQAFYAPLDISYSNVSVYDERTRRTCTDPQRGRDLGIFLCYSIFNILVLLLAARYLSYTKR
jgi:ABC-type multidrug transport system permease subunit